MCILCGGGSIKRDISESLLTQTLVARMGLFLFLFPLLAGSVMIGSLELIRRFTLSQPVGNRTVSY